MAVHFKFRSAVDYDSINLDDLFISVRNLKQRIVEHKNLASNRTIDFDLVITDSQTGEEFQDDNYLVPRNTSVIIKRVPAAKSKSFFFDQPRFPPKQNVPAPAPVPSQMLPLQQAMQKSEAEGDDFGVDLYAAPAAPPAKSDEDAKIMEMVSKSTLEWQRFDTTFPPSRGGGGGGGGRGRGRGSGPPAGYVCHRCGQPGHFIQQCPTNGDPNYDIKKVRLPVGIPRTRLRIDQEGSYVLPDGTVAAMQPDENLFAKEADALMSVKSTTEAPPELRCPLCRSTFKEAVMIPCCHYSFCDKCIRQSLMMKGQCPQCGSLRFKNDDLLPNIALRQAIDKFLESSGAVDHTVGVPVGDSASQMNAPSESKHSADDNGDAGKLRGASSGVVIAESSVTDANLHPVIPKDASGSVNLEGNEPVRDNGDGGKSSEPLIHKGAEDIALESEVSKGKKKKKRPRGVNSVDGGGVDAATSVKGERFCFQCGSPGHIAKDCVENMGSYPPHPGMFPPGGPFPMGPYGPEMFWHGPPVPFAPGYGDGMYGPALGGMPPMPPAGAYQMPPCMPPPYPGVPSMHWFGEHPGMMAGEMPVSREEFLKLQEDEHNRRAMNDHRGEWSHNRPSQRRSSDNRERNGSYKSESDYNSRSYSDKYRDHPGDKYREHPGDKYRDHPGDKYRDHPPGDKYRDDKYKQRPSDDPSRRKSERERRSVSLERNGGGYEQRRDGGGGHFKERASDKEIESHYRSGEKEIARDAGHRSSEKDVARDEVHQKDRLIEKDNNTAGHYKDRSSDKEIARDGGYHKDRLTDKDHRPNDKDSGKDGGHYKDKQQHGSAAESDVGRESRRYSDVHPHKEAVPHKEERRSKFSSKPPPAEAEQKEKRIEQHQVKAEKDLTSRSRAHDREADYSSDDAGKRKKRRDRSRDVEERSHPSSKYADDYSRKYSEAATDDHSRWKPDYYEDERYYRDDRKHSSSSSRHHHRR